MPNPLTGRAAYEALAAAGAMVPGGGFAPGQPGYAISKIMQPAARQFGGSLGLSATAGPGGPIAGLGLTSAAVPGPWSAMHDFDVQSHIAERAASLGIHDPRYSHAIRTMAGGGPAGSLLVPTIQGGGSHVGYMNRAGDLTRKVVGGILPSGAMGIQDRLSYGTALGLELINRSHAIQAGGSKARAAIASAMGGTLGRITWTAEGAVDFLKAKSTLAVDIARGLESISPTWSSRLGTGPVIPTDAGGYLDRLSAQLARGQGVGLSAVLSKPEQLAKGIFGPQPGDVSPFGQFYRQGRANIQHIAFPEVSAGVVGRMEAGLGGPVPRIGVKGGQLRNFGQFQEVFGRVAVVPQRSKMGLALARGAAGYEGAVLHERFRGMAFEGGRVEVGTAMSIMGQKFNVAGFGTATAMTGRDAIITANLFKDPEAYARASLGHVTAEAWRLNKGRLPQELQNVMRAQFGEFELRQTQLMLAPTANRLATVGMAKRAANALARAAGVAVPFRLARIQGGQLAHMATLPMSFRGTFAASAKGVRFDALNMMGMATMGPASKRVARRLLSHVVNTRGVEARQTLAFLNPMLGRQANLAGVPNIAAGAYHPGVHRLTTARTVGDVMALREAGILPMGAQALTLPTPVRVPTQRAFELLGKDLEGWAKWRGSGFQTSVLPMPSLSSFKAFMGEETAQAYLPEFARQYGRVIGAAQGLEKAVAAGVGVGGAQVALETAYGQMGGMIMGHSQKGGLLQQILNPRMQIGRSVYATLQGGEAAAAMRGVAGPMDVGVGEVGISPRMAKKLGISKAQRRRIFAGQGGNFFVGTQVSPSVVGEASRVMRLRIDPRIGSAGILATNVADRLAGFRDLDWDKMHLYLFPHEIGRKMRSALKAAHLEQITRVSDLYRLAQGNVLLPGAQSMRGLSAQEGIRKLISQKQLTPLWDKPVRMWQGTALQMFGSGGGDVMRALGVSYQMAIQKGGGGAGTQLLEQLFVGSGGDVKKMIPGIRTGLEQVAATARGAGVLGFGEVTNDLAERVARVAVASAGLKSSTYMRDLFSREGGLKPGEFLNRLMTVRGQRTGTGRWVDRQVVRMIGLGQRASSIDMLADSAGFTPDAVNAAMKAEGAASGNIWTRMPRWAKIGAGAFGALLGLRIIKSHLFGDEPDVPAGMRIPPEVAARMAMGQVNHGAPLPPNPMVGGGLHQSMMPRPMVPFSPPPARINSPLSRGQEIRIDAMETTGMDMHMMGMSMSAALEGVGASANLTGVYSTNLTPSTRIAELNAREDRMNSRFFNA